MQTFPSVTGASVTYTTPVTRYLEVDGGRIAYDDTSGSGSLVIAIPGMGDLRAQYRKLRSYLVAAGYRVITMDIRGHGESSASWNDYSAHAVGRDALALITKLEAQSAFMIGNSFAAGAALWAAREAPAKIRGVVLIGPIVRDLPVAPWMRAVLNLGFAGPWRYRFWTAYWNSLFPTHKPADHAHYRALLVNNLKEPGRFDALKAMVKLSKADTEATLDDASVPSLIVMGTKDADFRDPADEARRLASRLGATTLMVEGAGHYPHAEMPEAVSQGLIAFLEKSRYVLLSSGDVRPNAAIELSSGRARFTAATLLRKAI
ncbi:alpha/beta hydrolase [Parapusillimonas sp. SGNA-6]|nr:alpha/beta hydrolase [Parapusillimonas sp. SGNA-6]